MQQFFAWLQSTGLARTVGESPTITGGLSAAHLIGFTLVMSSALIWNFRAAGVLWTKVPSQSIAKPATRLLVAGLAISVLTGFALFAPRAADTAPSGVFQLKMGLLLAAATYQLVLSSAVLGRPTLSPPWLRASGALGLALWLSLAITACWFILFE
jgi:hypothetical protein